MPVQQIFEPFSAAVIMDEDEEEGVGGTNQAW
jgi:hypothetical protein